MSTPPPPPENLTWPEFISGLERLDWESQEYDPNQFEQVEALLRGLAAAPEQIRQRTEAILADDDLFRSYEPHTDHPRMLMDKFMIYMDPDDRFRVRLHRFHPRAQNGTLEEYIHEHKWHASTIILKGGYTENVYRSVTEAGNSKAQLIPVDRHVLQTGDTNSLPVGTPHQVVNQSETEPCLTLFVRGKTLRSAAIRYAPDGTIIKTYDPLTQKRVGLRAIGQLQGDFLY